MADYQDRLLALLEEKIGTRNVIDREYKDITVESTIDTLDNKNVIGSITLSEGRIELPYEAQQRISEFLAVSIP
jgi:hypothetical protein